MSLGVIFGILAMLGWGTADFFVANAVRRECSIFKTFLWSQITSVTLFSLIFLVFFGDLPDLSQFLVGLILIAGFLGTFSYVAYYKGLRIGKVSIISPIGACWGAIVAVLGVFFLNETLTVAQGTGVALAILGVILASFKLHDLLGLTLRNLMQGVEFAAIAALAWGTQFTLIGVLVEELGWFVPIFFIKATAVLYLLVYAGARRRGREEFSFPRNITLFVVLIGVFETISFLAYGFGVSSEHSAIVAPIGASFPIITIIWARLFFKETLEINQKIGVFSVILGLVLLAM